MQYLVITVVRCGVGKRLKSEETMWQIVVFFVLLFFTSRNTRYYPGTVFNTKYMCKLYTFFCRDSIDNPTRTGTGTYRG
jgi:hypothetical protein